MRREPAIPTRSEIVERAAAGTLLAAMFNEFGGRVVDADDPTLLALIDAHNNGAVDLLGLATPDAIATLAADDGFDVYRALIPHLEGPPEAMLRTVRTLYAAAGNDGLAAADHCDVDLPGNPHAAMFPLEIGRDGRLVALG